MTAGRAIDDVNKSLLVWVAEVRMGVYSETSILASGIITLYYRFLTQLQGRGGANLKIGECEIGLAE